MYHNLLTWKPQQRSYGQAAPAAAWFLVFPEETGALCCNNLFPNCNIALWKLLTSKQHPGGCYGQNASQEPSKSLHPNIGSKKKKSPCAWESRWCVWIFPYPSEGNSFLKERLRCYQGGWATTSYISDSLIISMNSSPQEWFLIPWQEIWDPQAGAVSLTVISLPHYSSTISPHRGPVDRTSGLSLALQSAQ